MVECCQENFSVKDRTLGKLDLCVDLNVAFISGMNLKEHLEEQDTMEWAKVNFMHSFQQKS